MADPDLKVTDPHHIPVVFCNQVTVAGFLNGNCNITLAVAQFTENDEGDVKPDLVVAARLRFDLRCAQMLYQHLGHILSQNTVTQPQPEKPN